MKSKFTLFALLMMLSGSSAFAQSCLTTTAGSPQTLCAGYPTTTLGATSGTTDGTVTYTWTELSHTGTFVAGSFSSPSSLNTTYTPNVGTVGTVTLQLATTISGSSSCSNGTTNSPVVITVSYTPQILSTNNGLGSATICTGGDVQLTATFYGTGSWYSAATGGTAFVNSGLTIGIPAGETSSSGEQFNTPSSTNITTTFYVAATNLDGCTTPTRTAVTEVVYPTGMTQTDASVCSDGSASVTLGADFVTPVTGEIIDWYSSNSTPLGSPIATSTTTYSPSVSASTAFYVQGTYTYTVGGSTYTCTSPVTPVNATVYPLPTVYPINSPANYCSASVGAGIDVSLSNSGGDVTYALYLNGTPTGSLIEAEYPGYPVDFRLQTAVGVYTIVATNYYTGGCTDVMSGNITINQTPPAITVPSDVCAGSQITVTDATGGGIFTISAGDAAYATVTTDGTLTGVSAGTPTVTYTIIATGCYVTAPVVVNSVASITSATSAASPICPSATTNITANGVAGTGATLTWYTGSDATGTNLGTANPLTGVGPGTYYAYVTGTCGTAQASATVGSLTNVSITSATSDASPICPSATTNITANGVLGTIATLTWWTGAGGTGTNLGSANPLSVGPGTYYADVTGTCGATAEASVTVGSLTNVGITSATSATSPICPSGSTNITANGVVGTAATLTWWTGVGGTGTNLGSANPLSVGPGTYYAYVTGTCGAPAQASVVVGSNTNVGITSATSATSPICLGTTTSITANGVVGTGATLTWYTGSSATGTNLGHTNPLTGVGPGTYYAYVTGTCGAPAQASIVVGSNTNVGITSATSAASPICPGTTTSITANGVTGTGATLTWYTGSGATGTNLGHTNPLTGVGPGTYYAYVTGTCGTPAQASVVIGSNTNAAITSATATASSICPGGTTTITASGVSGTGASLTWWTGTGGTGTNLGSANSLTGVGPGTYYAYVTGTCGTAQASATVGTSALPTVSISSSGNLTCTATSATLTASGASTYTWSGSSSTSSTRSVTAAGTYTVTGTGSDGCSAAATYTESLTTTPLATLTVTVVNNCGSSTLTAAGIVSGATVTWSPSGSGNPLTVTAAGSYTATQSLSGCTSTASAAVTAAPGSGLTLTPTITNVSCHGGSNGSISVAATGGSGSYTYSWAPCGGSSNSITGKTAGTYTVTVTNGACHATCVYTITQPSTALAVSGTVTNVTCNGGDNGSISTTVSGGTPSYSYLWSPGGATTSGISGKVAGTYDVTVTDAHGCTASGAYTITQPGAITCSINVTPSTTCYTGGVPTNFYLGYGPQSATCNASCSAGLGCTYSWSGSSGTSCLNHTNINNPVYTCSAAGSYTYSCTVTTESGCSTKQTVHICVVDCQDHSHSGNILVCRGSGCTPTTVSCGSGSVPGYITPSLCPSNHLGAVGSGCDETAGRESGDVDGKAAVINELTVNAFPNPFNSAVNVKIQSNLMDNVDVNVYDVTGRVMETKPGQAVDADIMLGQNLVPGIYIIEVRQGEEMKKVKVVKY